MTKKNRWWLIALYLVLALLVVAIVVSCFVKVSSKPQINAPDIYSITIEDQAVYDIADKTNEPEKYKKINEAFENSFKEAFLTSLFSGRLSFESRIDNQKPSSFSGYKVRLIFANDQTIMLNGKEYNPPTNTAETVKYNEILIDVQSGKGYTTQYIYYPYEYVDSANQTQTGYYRQSIVANFDDLYTLLAK